MPANFADELRRHGPTATESLDLGGSQAYCARLAATHYENFHVVTILTPRELRPAFAAIYAYCRWSDDLADETGDRRVARELLAWWRGELEAAYAGRARHPVMQALQPVIAEYGIPIDPFAALLSAFEQDQDVLEYDTYDQLLDYCTRSANPVGHLVLYLCRAFDEARATLADATCTALQLANFWQDVVPDLEQRSRIYLPREDLSRFSVTRGDLAERRFTPAFRDLMEFEVHRARALFQQGWPLVSLVPRAVAVDVDLFTRGGLAILDAIEGRGFDVLSARPALGKATKAGLLARALLARINPLGFKAPAHGAGRTCAYGPLMPDQLRESYRFCERVARREAANFYCSFLLLPSDRRHAMSALYAYMRHTDDLADEPGKADQKAVALDAWREALVAALAGDAGGAWPGLPALAHTVQTYGVPPQYLLEVIDGVRMDVDPRPFADFEALKRYCYLVASTVGLACLHIWGFRSQDGDAEKLAVANGLALQLTNIIRDVREDACNGRVYLPVDEMERFQVGAGDLTAERVTPALRELLAFQAERARAYYLEAAPLAGLVARRGRPVLRTITGVYRTLLDAIVERDYDVMSARVRVPNWRKAAIAARALVS